MKQSELTELLNKKILIFDGAMGTELYRRHVFTNRSYDELCLSNPALVKEVHKDYLAAGADVLTSNTYAANRLSLKKFALSDKVHEINTRAVELLRESVAEMNLQDKILLAGSIGPIEQNPGLEFNEEEYYDVLAEQASALIDAGVDFIIFETISSIESAKAAAKVIKNLSEDFAYVISHAIPDGEDIAELVKHRLKDLSDISPAPAALGFNCGLGPAPMLEVMEVAREISPLPLIIQPNAGTPHKIDNRQLYLCSPEYLSTYAVRYVNLGARAVGGCCGTTPEHIKDLAAAVKPLTREKKETVISIKNDAQEQKVEEVKLADKSAFGKKLAEKEWITAVEITPPRGWNTERIVASAKLCKEYGVDTINVPDGPRAAPRLSALITSLKIQQEADIETILHVCSRDRNYLGLQADLLGCAACGIKNMLFITGDPPKLGGYGFATGVFDTDAIGLVNLQKHLNQGIDLGGQQIKPPTAAVIGVGADPNALDFEKEIYRLQRKVEAGAEFITTQPIFEADVFKRFMDEIAHMNIPVIAGIWPLASLRNALFMKNEVPGVSVPDSIISEIEKGQTREEQLAAGIRIARSAIEEIRDLVAGVQVSAPLGNVKAALDVLF